VLRDGGGLRMLPYGAGARSELSMLRYGEGAPVMRRHARLMFRYAYYAMIFCRRFQCACADARQQSATRCLKRWSRHTSRVLPRDVVDAYRAPVSASPRCLRRLIIHTAPLPRATF